METERKEQERLEQIRLETERKEQERLDQIRLETERKEKECLSEELSDKEKTDDCRHVSYIEIFFRCCHIYGKLYINVNRDYYVGKCPRCKLTVTVPVGINGPKFGLTKQKYHNCG